MSVAVAADASEPISELNTTPLIDVMLVLLIMFIITIPIQTHAVRIDLPGSEVPPPDVDPVRNKIAIEASGALLWNGRSVDLAGLRSHLSAAAALRSNPELHIEPHQDARYEIVDEVLAATKRANIRSMGIVGNERYARF